MGRMKKPADEKLFTMICNWLKIYLPSERAVSSNTVASYREALNQYLDYLSEKNNIRLNEVTFSLMTKDSLNDYLNHLQLDLNLSKATRNTRLAAIRAFIQYASACAPEYLSTALDVAKIKTQKDDPFSKVEFMTEAATKAILSEPDISQWMGRRDQAILTMLYDTGARISGLLGIRLCDLHMDSKSPTVTVVEKGNVVRTIPLTPENFTILKKYLSEFHAGISLSSQAYLFYVSHKTGRLKMCAQTVRERIDKYVASAKLKCPEVPEHVHPHMWRHTRAMHLYQHGMPLQLVAQWLGHKNQTTTLVYAHADTEQKRKAIEKAMQAGAPKANGNDSEMSEAMENSYRVTDEETLKRLYGLK